MLEANHPPQPPTINQLDRYRIGVKDKMRHKLQEIITPRHTLESQARRQATSNTQPLRGSLYAVGVTHVVRITNSEFGSDINQFDEHRNRFIEVIERVRFLDADGVLTDRIIVIVCGVIVQIVAHDDSPRIVIVKIGEDVRMIPRAALIFIFLHLAKRSQP